MTTLAWRPTITVRRPARPVRRHLWLVPGIALGLVAGEVSDHHGMGLLPLLAFGVVPHLAVLLGIGQPRPRGHLGPRAVPLFNALHEPVVPLALLGAVATSLLSPFWLVAGLAWLGHIVVDWGLGHGLRHRDGSLMARSVLEMAHRGVVG
ncbi:MAG: DUF4260 family protein [Chloroflexota bacterium]